MCQEPACGRPFDTARGLASHRRQAHPAQALPASPTAAIEAALKTLTLTASQAVLAANVRELAKALEACDPTDKAKTAKELRAQWAELVGVTGGDRPSGPDWTEGDGDD